MKLSPRACYSIAAALLLVMAALMFGAARRDSATVDETTALSAGYTYWKGHRYYFVPEHPPVGQMWSAIPLLFMDVKISENAQAILDGRVTYQWTRPWAGPLLSVQSFNPNRCNGQLVGLQQPPFHPLVIWSCPTGPYPLQNWYLWALPESQIFGQMLIYDGTNDGSAMLLAGRCMQILLTAGVGLLIFFWIRRATHNDWAALVGLAFWAFNPNVLAHGHLTTTDMGATFGIALASFLFSRLLESMTLKSAMAWGASVGLALVLKLTAVILGPIFLLLLVIHWRKLKASPVPVWKLLGAAVLMGWAVVMIVYFPNWSAPPPIDTQPAKALGVPDWFTSFRPLLIPRDFFKAFGLTLGHSKEGHDAYLMGEWSQKGWWYYYPLTFFFKSPLGFVIMVVIATATFLKRCQTARPFILVPWIAAATYLAFAMASNANIGIRHILPIFPLICVGIGASVVTLTAPRWKTIITGLAVWQAAITLMAAPCYIQFFSEAVGGSKNGYQYLADSNYDWGQDANRLKDLLAEKQITHIYLDYFGTQYNIEYLKIPNTRIDAKQAQQIKSGWIVVSASQLVRPEWAWLRNSHTPAARAGDTLFLYQLP